MNKIEKLSVFLNKTLIKYTGGYRDIHDYFDLLNASYNKSEIETDLMIYLNFGIKEAKIKAKELIEYWRTE